MTSNTSAANGTALITGASSGIGAVYADRLARRGYDLVLVARDQQRLAALADKLATEAGVKVEVLQADLTVKADLLRIEQRLRSDASLSLLVNNAGNAVVGPLLTADIDKVEAMLQLNVVAPTRLAAAAAANFAARKTGTIVNIASVVAYAPGNVSGSYSATKAFALNFTQAMQEEFGPQGVRVQAVLPGATRTEIWERGGLSVDNLPASMVMEVGEMVDAALAGLDSGEAITIPALESLADWQAMETARKALGPNLSTSRSASRYRRAA
ncbi:SDR family oxidoreductase [Rhodoferax koreense]|uniref:SDR family oxidoreductase n=2 Tax=Rhodoferax koreensis TaxID=1842727 RepID=A0A1P8K4Q9_9BURK|nr:SDR family oxidoreductase [Rhodoferax koreense]